MILWDYGRLVREMYKGEPRMLTEKNRIIIK